MVTNPKMLIAFVVLIALAVYADVYVLHARGNPLPDPDDVSMVSFAPAYAPAGSPPRTLDIARYRQLHDCVDGFGRVMHSGTGDVVGTLVIHRADGSTTQATLYQWGLVQTEEGLFTHDDGERTNRLCSIIRSL